MSEQRCSLSSDRGRMCKNYFLYRDILSVTEAQMNRRCSFHKIKVPSLAPVWVNDREWKFFILRDCMIQKQKRVAAWFLKRLAMWDTEEFMGRSREVWLYWLENKTVSMKDLRGKSFWLNYCELHKVMLYFTASKTSMESIENRFIVTVLLLTAVIINIVVIVFYY